MQRQNLLKTLEKFEEPFETDEEVRECDKITIFNDINRTDFNFSDSRKNLKKLKLYLEILNRTFSDFPIPYYQGMMEVATVLIDAYFGHISIGHDSRDISLKPLKLDDITDDEKLKYDKILKENATLFTRYRNSLVNILTDKFLYLTRDNFRKYNQLNEKLVKMINSMDLLPLKPCEPKIDEFSSLKYMNHTLSFFKRLSANSEVIFTIFNLILNSDHQMIFSILIFYLKKADEFTGNNLIISENDRSRFLISEITEADIKKILRIHELFLKGNFSKCCISFLKKPVYLAFFAAVLGLVIAFALYNR